MAKTIMSHSELVDGVFPRDYPITYGHLINSFCFDLEPSILLIKYSTETSKRFCQFCFEHLAVGEQNKYEFYTSWHPTCKTECIYMNC